jgi:GNAT superfamily N-acetyltransferase
VEPTFHLATEYDLSQVLPLMRDFYAFEKIPYDESRSLRLLTQLVRDSRFGHLVLINAGQQLVGYMMIGFGFSVEFGGRDALLDELFILPNFRGKGYGSRAIDFALALCADEQIEALHLEADHFNESAHKLYLSLGFKDHQRHLMTRRLS